jgi:hypothetical protein
MAQDDKKILPPLIENWGDIASFNVVDAVSWVQPFYLV